MMNSTINICGIPFVIKEVDEIPAEIKGEIVHGEISHSRAEILLRKSLPNELKRLALIHEWVHGVLVMIGRADLSDDEMLVQNIALAIYNAFDVRGEVISDYSMEMRNETDFNEYLKEQLKDTEFKRAFDEADNEVKHTQENDL